MYQVYVVYNFEAGKFYIGQTENLARRLSEHNDRVFNNSYTSRFAGEWKLIYKEECSNRTIAVKREKQLKSSRGRQFIKNIIKPK